MQVISNSLTKIHPSAVLSGEAVLGQDVAVGPHSIIEGRVSVADNTRIDANVLIAAVTTVGSDCVLSHGAVLGTPPQDLKYAGEESFLEVGNNTVIREYCTLNRGTGHGGKVTRVGKNCLLMAYAHVAHDCQIGNNVILANAINMAGHVEIADNVSIGGMSAIHQFVKIGQYAFIGGMSRIAKDVPPFILTTGADMRYYGPNVIGLRRNGFSNERIRLIKKAYQYIYLTKLNLTQAIGAINDEMDVEGDVKTILDFIASSERGIMGK